MGVEYAYGIYKVKYKKSKNRREQDKRKTETVVMLRASASIHRREIQTTSWGH